MEKKKLLLVAISVGVFLALAIGAAILVFSPKNASLPFETISGNTDPASIYPISTYQSPIAIGVQPQPTIDAVDLARNPDAVPGLVTQAGGASQGNETIRGADTVIDVAQPTTAAVPTTAPTGRAANQSTPAAATRPSQTTPARTSSGTSSAASTPAQTAPSSSQAASASPAQTAQTQAATNQSSTASAPAQTAPVQTTTVALAQPNPAANTRAGSDFWVQTGAFSTLSLAEGVITTLASKGITAIVEDGVINGRTLFRVRVGPYTTQNEANYWLALIKSMDGFEDSQVRVADNLH